MHDRLRVTVQYLLTILLGLIVSEIFGCLLAGGFYIKASTSSMLEFKQFNGISEPIFLVMLALNFIRIGHGLIIMETSESCKDYHDFIKGIKWLSVIQLFVLCLFVALGIILLLILPTTKHIIFNPGNLSLMLFGVLALWDIPTGVRYYYDWSKGASAMPVNENITHHALLYTYLSMVKKAREKKIFRALTNWVLYDIACIFIVIFDLLILKNSDFITIASILLLGLFVVDYYPFQKPMFLKKITNGDFYFS